MTLFFTRVSGLHPFLIVGSVLLTSRYFTRAVLQCDFREEFRPISVPRSSSRQPPYLSRRRVLFGFALPEWAERLSVREPDPVHGQCVPDGFSGGATSIRLRIRLMGAFAVAMFTVVVMLMNRGNRHQG